ncbi:MAG: CoA-binding protein, partial [Lysobacterales bacterium]
DPVRIGGAPLRALVEFGYQGKIYPVNPKYEHIYDLRCYADVGEIDGPCDLAVIAVPAHATPEILRACGRKGIAFATVLSGGFRESGINGVEMEGAVLQALEDSGIRMIGPNCQGLVNLSNRLYAAFGAIANEPDMRAGYVSMVFQSGGLGFTVALLCEASGIGFRYLVSSGNETDLTTPEFLDAFLDDNGTKVAFALIEGVEDGRALQAVGRKGAQLGKPVIVWKIGNTEVGARAAKSHTAGMTGRYDIYRAAFQQAGILEVRDVDEIQDLFAIFCTGKLPKGDGVAVMTITGGSGIAFADRAIDGGLRMATLSDATTEILRSVVPTFGSVDNPVDVTANLFNDVGNFTTAVEAVLSDESVDQLCVLMASIGGTTAVAVARAIVDAANKYEKPMSVAWSARRGSAEEAFVILEQAGIPTMPTPVRAATAAIALYRFAQSRRRMSAVHPNVEVTRAPHELPDIPGTLNEVSGKALLKAYGVPVTRDWVVRLGDDIAPIAEALSFPVVVKVLSADIAHKTDVGGVRVGIDGPAELEAAILEVTQNARNASPHARIDGALVSEMVTGVESLAGIIDDSVFGPTVAFGLGGVFTEVLHDIAYRVAPFAVGEAMEMIDSLRGRALFDGVRGGEALDIQALAESLAALSQMAWDLRDRIAEMDVNPLFVRPLGQGVIAADALIVLK